jgi:hypothetical protein
MKKLIFFIFFIALLFAGCSENLTTEPQAGKEDARALNEFILEGELLDPTSNTKEFLRISGKIHYDYHNNPVAEEMERAPMLYLAIKAELFHQTIETAEQMYVHDESRDEIMFSAESEVAEIELIKLFPVHGRERDGLFLKVHFILDQNTVKLKDYYLDVPVADVLR